MRAPEGLWALAQGFRCGPQSLIPSVLQLSFPYSASFPSSSCQLQSLSSFKPISRPPHLPRSAVHDTFRTAVAVGAAQKPQHAACRGFANSTSRDGPPTLKQRIRELMLMVHPDRWTAHPEAQRENERSFKLLNEYLDAAKAVRRMGGSSAALKCFYTCPSISASCMRRRTV